MKSQNLKTKIIEKIMLKLCKALAIDELNGSKDYTICKFS